MRQLSEAIGGSTWLHATGFEGFTTGTINMASELCHVHVEFLYKHYQLKCNKDIINQAARYYDFSVLECIMKNDPSFTSFKHSPRPLTVSVKRTSSFLK